MFNDLSFTENIRNVEDCINNLQEIAENYIKTLKENNPNTIYEEEYIAHEDVEQCMDFLSCIKEIVCGACVLAVYAGGDWEIRPDKYGFGADGYEYVEKYIKGGMDMSAIYGETDFHNDYMDYFKKNIKP